ncbi:MAG: DUF4382 domain-containing protein [Burkholderiaceae bacterium]
MELQIEPSVGAWIRAARRACLGAASGILVACGGGGGGAADGTLRVALTDAPSCGYDHVFVTVEKVRVHQSSTASDADSGWSEIPVSPARRIDLLTLTNGVLTELGSTPLPAGNYSQIRLVLADNSAGNPTANAVQPTGGAEVALRTPSAQQSGLKLQTHFEVASGQTADLVLDFDACKSIAKAGNSGQYNLKPVMAVLQRLGTSIEGFVSTTIANGSTTVSAQQNGVPVRATTPDASGKFVLSLLPDGSYTVVVTADGRETAVVTGVPVALSAGKTLLNGTATSIAPAAATMRDVTGTVTLVTSTPGGTTSAPLTDATVRTSQTLTGGLGVEVSDRPVDAIDASYRFRLPAAAPVRASYVSAATPLSFAPDAPVAGKYSIAAQAPGQTIQTKSVDITSINATATFTFGP